MTRFAQHILVVDDSPVNIQLLAATLVSLYEIHFATHGPQALEFVRTHPVDLILLDVAMPGMDGFEVCRRLKADESTRDIPVIFVTALMEMQDETAGFEVGAVDYIVKPVNAPIVRARVRTHLELKSQRDQLRRLSLSDGLTGIANRRCFDEVLEKEWRRAMRHNAPLSLLVMDIDHFKRFNDHYGHLEGDQCLQRVAAVLATLVQRPGDLVARYGGEEFAVVLTGCDARGAQVVAAACVERVARLAIPHAASKTLPYVTLSVGATTIIPVTVGQEPESLVIEADRQLYQAKSAGRNRYLHGMAVSSPCAWITDAAQSVSL